MCTFIRFLHGGQLKGGWLGHLSTSISLFYFFVISETCSSKVMGCTMCVNGTNNLPNCTQCEAGTTLDPQTNECKSDRKSLLICLSIHPSVCLSVCLSQVTNKNPNSAHKNTFQQTNKHICVSGGKMAQDVGMVWKCCCWFLRVPSLHVLFILL